MLWKLVIPVSRSCGWSCPGYGATSARSRRRIRPRALFGLSKALTAPEWLKQYGFPIAAGLFILFVSLRKVGLDDSGPATAILLFAALRAGFVGGVLFRGKSGWCSSVARCCPCSGCTGRRRSSPCRTRIAGRASAAPRTATTSTRRSRTSPTSTTTTALRRLPAASSPPRSRGSWSLSSAARSAGVDVTRMYGEFAAYMAASLAAFTTLDAFAKVRADTLTALFAAAAFNDLLLVQRAANWSQRLAWPRTPAPPWPVRAAAARADAGVVRAHARQRAALRRTVGRTAAAAAVAARQGAAARDREARRTREARRSTFEPEGKHGRGAAGQDAARGRRAGGLAIESGCRMGMCGADPVAVLEGMENLSAHRRRRAHDARAARPRRQHAAGLLRAGAAARCTVSLDAASAAQRRADAVARRASDRLVAQRGGDRQRHRRRDRRRPRPARAIPTARSTSSAARSPPPLQPHGHHAA